MLELPNDNSHKLHFIADNDCDRKFRTIQVDKNKTFLTIFGSQCTL